MKTHLKLIAVLFLAGFALLGQSCAEEEFPPRPGPAFPADITNRYALLLQEQLQADGAANDRYTEVLSDRTPVYEEVRFATHSAYGLCYIIPYYSSSGSTIEGAVYLPVGATCAEDGTVTFDGSLGTPVDMDAPTINRDAPFTERYTYSMPFKHLQNKGWNVDPDLLLYAELLDNNIIPLSPEDFPDDFIHTKATTNILEIYMHYNSEYVGGRTDAVIGMHPDLLIRVIEESLKRLGIRGLDNPCQHRFLTMIISIPEDELPSYSVNVFIDQLVFEIRQALIVQGFELSIHYTFEFKSYTVSGGSSTGESGGISGGSTGNSGSSSKIAPQGNLSKAIFNTASRLTAQQWEKVEKALEKINNDCLGGKLIGEVKATGIQIVHCDTMKANGSYKHGTKQLKIKNFKETDMDDRTFEKTLLHELIHSRQSGKVSSAMNQEIEVRIADFVYAAKNKIPRNNSQYIYVKALLTSLNSKYNIIDQESFDLYYKDYVEGLQTDKNYSKFKESLSDRNLNTIQRLAKDC